MRLTQRLIATLCCAVLMTGLLQGCQHKPEWNAKDISGLMPKLEFNLTDENGQGVTADTYKGKIVMLFFGYTNCPDYCPTTLSKLARVLKNVPDAADKVRVLFVSVDPKRDDPHRLAVYTSNFAPEIIGLTGSQTALRALAKRYRTTFGYGKPDRAGNYVVTHGLAVYVFDTSGKARLMILSKEKVPEITADLKRLVSRTG